MIIAPAANFAGLRQYGSLLRETGGYIAGGAFKNIFLKEEPRDIDLFFNTPADFGTARNKVDYPVIYENNNTICYYIDGHRVEFIRAQFGPVEEMLDRFDFTIAKFALYVNDNDALEAMYHEDFFEHLLQRKLVIDSDLPYPLNTFERTLKYTRYGFSLCQDSKEDLVDAIRRSSGDPIPTNFYGGID